MIVPTKVTLGASRLAFASLMTLVLGCGIAQPPIKDTPKIAATPQNGQFSIVSKAADPVGDVTPVYLSVTNGTSVNRKINPSQIFALDSNGDRVAPLPPAEAARQAGGAGTLKASLVSGAVGGVAGAALGTGLGAAAGAILGETVTGAAIGGATGAGAGIYNSVGRGQDQAYNQANAQINALAIPEVDVRQDFTVSGYVFFPKGNYSDIVMLLSNSETGNTEIIKQPWR